MKVVVALCLLAVAAVQVHAMPNGAPEQACADNTPGGPHQAPMPPYVNNTANMSDNPFQLDLSEFRCPNNQAGLCYVPGTLYRITLSGMNNEEFRGLLVQGRVYADQMTRTGTFVGFTNNTRASDCTPRPESAVTHSNPSVKITVILYWISPPRGTGDIEFLWAVVVVLVRNVSNEWYGPIRTALIMETDGCPDLSIGNGSVSYNPNGTQHFIGTTATYTCDEDYVLDGNSTRTCEAANNGNWTGSDPVCLRTCANYSSEVGPGRVTYTPPDTPFREGTVGMTTCDPGFPLRGTPTRTCQDSGEWSSFTICGAPFTTVVSLWLLLTLLAATYLL